MTDKELIKWLRGLSKNSRYNPSIYSIAADRLNEAIARAEQAEARERDLIEGAEINRQTLLKHNADHAKQVATLQARVAELEGALRFYANPENHKHTANHPYMIGLDNGDRARAALAGETVGTVQYGYNIPPEKREELRAKLISSLPLSREGGE